MDPFTGAQAYQSATAQANARTIAPSVARAAPFPLNEPVVFKTVNEVGLLKKISEFSASAINPLSAEELHMVSLIIAHVASPAQSLLDAAAAEGLIDKICGWPPGKRFPGKKRDSLFYVAPASFPRFFLCMCGNCYAHLIFMLLLCSTFSV